MNPVSGALAKIYLSSRKVIVPSSIKLELEYIMIIPSDDVLDKLKNKKKKLH
jgi:hypothetical protein